MSDQNPTDGASEQIPDPQLGGQVEAQVAAQADPQLNSQVEASLDSQFDHPFAAQLDPQFMDQEHPHFEPNSVDLSSQQHFEAFQALDQLLNAPLPEQAQTPLQETTATFQPIQQADQLAQNVAIVPAIPSSTDEALIPEATLEVSLVHEPVLVEHPNKEVPVENQQILELSQSAETPETDEALQVKPVIPENAPESVDVKPVDFKPVNVEPVDTKPVDDPVTVSETSPQTQGDFPATKTLSPASQSALIPEVETTVPQTTLFETVPMEIDPPHASQSTLNPDDVSALSSFLDYPTAGLTSLPANLVAQMMYKVREVSSLQAEKMQLEVSLETASHQSQGKLSAIRKQYMAAQKELTQQKKTLATLTLEKEGLQLSAHAQSGDVQKWRAASQAADAKLADVLVSKRTALDILAARENDIRIFKLEIDTLRETTAGLRRQLVEVEQAKDAVTAEKLKLQFAEKTTAQALASCKKSLTWYEEELTSKSAAILADKRLANTTISDLTSKLDKHVLENQTLANSKALLEERLSDTATKLDQTLMRLKAVQDAEASDKESFYREMTSKDRLVGLYKKSSEDRKARIDQLEASLASLRSDAAAETSELRSSYHAKVEVVATLEQKVHLLEETLETLSEGSSAPLLSAAARQTVSKIEGVSLSQLYADFGLLKKQLTQERRQKEKLQQEIKAFVAELEARAPMVESTRARAQLLEQELSQMSYMLETAEQGRLESAAAAKAMLDNLRNAQLEISYLGKQKADLARQVQSLLIQITVGNDNGGPLTVAEKAAITQLLSGNKAVAAESDTDRLISERLVTFTNIAELQVRNEDLLKVTRQLGAKLEQQEQSLGQAEEVAINEAREAILTLQEDIESLGIKLDAVSRERDMYKEMADGEQKRLTGPVQQENQLIVRGNKADDTLVEIRAESQQNVDALNAQITKLSRDNSALSVSVARATSTAELAEERLASLRESLRYTQLELDTLRRSASAMSENLGKQEAKTQTITAELIEATHTLDTFRSENVNLKAEKSLWKTIEKRLHQDHAQLLEERSQLAQRVANHQSYADDRERLAGAAQARLGAQILSMDGELHHLRARLLEKDAEIKQTMAQSSDAAKAYQQRIDTLTSQVSQAREDLVGQKAAVASLTTQVTALSTTVDSLNQKIRFYAAEDDNALVGTLDGLKTELAAARADLELANQQAEEFKRVASAAEDALASMNAAFDEYKIASQTKHTEAATETESLRSQVDTLTLEISHLHSEEAAADQRAQQLTAEIGTLRAQVEANDTARTEYDRRVRSLQDDLQTQTKVTADAHTNYEQELQKHAEVAKTVSLLRAQATELQTKWQEATSQAKLATQSLQAAQQSWETQRLALEEQLRTASVRADDLASQNRILHVQLEKVNTPEAGSRYESETGDSSIQDVVSFLRREKESSDTQLSIATDEQARLRAKLDATTSELESVQTELAQARARDANAEKLTTEHQHLLEQINQMNLLRESNTTLRAESQQRLNRVVDLEGQVAALNASLDPLQVQVVQLKAEIEVKDQQLRLAEEDNQRWKQKAQDVLLRINKIDPEVHAELKEKVEVLGKQVEELTTQLATSKKALAEAEVAATNGAARVERMKAEFIQKLKQNKADSAAVLEAKERELAAKKAELAEEQSAIAKMKTEGEKTDVDAKLVEMQTQLTTAQQQLAEASTKDESIQELTRARDALQKTLDDLEADVETLKKSLITSGDAEAGAGIDALRAEFEKQKAEIANSFEAQKVEITRNAEAQKAELVQALESQKAEFAKAEQELRKEVEAKPQHASGTDEIQQLQKELEAKHAAETETRVKAAIEDTKARVRAPVEAKVQAIAENRFLRFKKEAEEEAAKREAEHQKELEAKSQQQVSEALSKLAEASTEELVQKLVEEQKAALARLTEEHTASIKKASDDGRALATRMADMKMKLLQTKLDKALKEVEVLKAPAARASALPTRPTGTVQAAQGSRIPQNTGRPFLNKPQRGGFQGNLTGRVGADGGKRPADFKAGPQAKKHKD
ncbi:hypothetical protein BABINDRAFT_163853 [Babjeviella inositovora NRRL Y-12698]|uniref:Uncharacterized protein n=1 Tax=Babjeviella inositovora NRRL Y-12698 TaxID=984486 RepID=A0A1E3QHF5_9ASCO|nr:uncharacterized protein BABINDRAFT_163853 [Babjeviella inositovora NRRL Y-12698]ODQ77126.1 hypothetical protein BABINDRAFT_163853 [Babjeviella inositovora NRRL Y-12698]